MTDVGFVKMLIQKYGSTPSPADIKEAVNAYLEDHPEAVAPIDDTAGEGDTNKLWSADKVAAETESLKEAIASFEKDEDGVRLNVAYTPTNSKYIYKDGTIQNGSSFSYTSPIQVKAGDLIEVYAKGYTTNISMIALTDSTGSTYTPAVVSNDSTLKTYSYTAKADGYIACSYNTADGCKVTIHSVDSNKLLDERMVAVEANALIVSALQTDAYLNVIAEGTAATMSQTGKYVDFNGTLQSSGSFNASAAISLPANSTIKFLAKGYTDNVAVLARLNGDGTYTPLIVPADSNEKYFVYTTYDAINVVISTNKSTSPVYSVYASKIDALDGKMNVIEDDLFAYATMGVIGDSLASGASNYPGSAADRPAYSWGKYIERVYGVETSLFTLGGFTTRSWLSTAQGLPALQAADPLDCYVIGLGQNDQYSLGDAYLGTVSDVHVGSESENADTYYGNYSKIIAAIKEKSPRAKIFCLTNARDESDRKKNYNNAIKTIVPLYTNTYLIDLAADPFYTSRVFNDAWHGGHSTAIGYKMIAKNIHDNIVKVMRQKITEFKDIQWIIDDHP